MSKEAYLVIPEEDIERVQVRITLDLSLADCAQLEREIRAAPGYQASTLASTLDDLIRNAKRTISGLKFEPEKVDEGNADAEIEQPGKVDLEQ